jgi:hypothetical protein
LVIPFSALAVLQSAAPKLKSCAYIWPFSVEIGKGAGQFPRRIFGENSIQNLNAAVGVLIGRFQSLHATASNSIHLRLGQRLAVSSGTGFVKYFM